MSVADSSRNRVLNRLIAVLLSLRLGDRLGRCGLDERRQLVRRQAHASHKADDVQILQLHPLLFQLPLTGLEFCDLGGVLLILVVDLLDFRIRFSSLL